MIALSNALKGYTSSSSEPTIDKALAKITNAISSLVLVMKTKPDKSLIESQSSAVEGPLGDELFLSQFIRLVVAARAKKSAFPVTFRRRLHGVGFPDLRKALVGLRTEVLRLVTARYAGYLKDDFAAMISQVDKAITALVDTA